MQDRYFTLWRNLSGRKQFLFFVLHYTLLFAVMWHFLFSPFANAGKSFQWTSDATSSYLPNLIYLSKTVRNCIQALLAGEGWQFPLYDFALGPVKQIVQTEPIKLLAVFWPWDKVDVLYDLLVVVRFYLVGLSFSIFGFRFSQHPLATLCGSLSYMFCGFGIYAGVKHPSFLSPMILLPLLILGAEKILRREKPWLFMAVVFLATVSSVYFAFMLAMAVFLYFIVRFFDLYGLNAKARPLNLIARFLLCGITALALSGIVLAPSLLQNTDTGRIGRTVFSASGIKQYLQYQRAYYQKFFGYYMIEPGMTGSWSCLGFSVLSLPAAVFLFLERKRATRSFRWLFVIFTFMLLLPIVGYALSGFDHISNRWCFVYAFFVSVVILLTLPDLAETSPGRYASVCAVCILFFAFCYFGFNKEKYISISGFVLLAIALLLIGLMRQFGKRRVLTICLLITCVSTYYSSYRMYDPEQRNFVAEFTKKGAAYGTYSGTQYGSIAMSIPKDNGSGLFRVVGDSIGNVGANISFYYDLNGLTYYSSYKYPSYSQWFDELELSDDGVHNSRVHKSFGPENRAVPLALSAVKYYAARVGSKRPLPKGFEEKSRIKNGNNTDVILENAYTLPVGYTYSNYISRMTYDELVSVEKEEAQLQGVVLDTAPTSSAILEINPSTTSEKVPCHVTETSGLTWKDGKLKVTEENATMVLQFEVPPDSDAYLRVVNLDLGSGSRYWILTASSNNAKTTASFSSNGYQYSNGRKTQILNLGHSEEGTTTCTLNFPSKGTFYLDDLEIWRVPLANYAEQIEALRAEPLENVKTNWRGLTGTISVSQDKMLCLAVPYDSRWSAFVDGVEVPVYQANTAWMAIELEKGDHFVEFKYWTPGLSVGICMSAAGLVGLGCFIFLEKRDKRNRSEGKPKKNRQAA